jgi:hypothetical protein
LGPICRKATGQRLFHAEAAQAILDDFGRDGEAVALVEHDALRVVRLDREPDQACLRVAQGDSWQGG